MTKPFTVVSFHAHPDDETLLTGGTLARLAAEGHRVVVVTATAGDAGLSASSSHAQPLDLVRLRELEAAVAILGCARLVVLGYGDSGSTGAADGTALVHADVDEVADRLVELLREENAHALTIYDRVGGYGHPDHARVHVIGCRAAERAGTPLVLEATVDRRALVRVSRLLAMIPHIPPEFRLSRLRGSFSPHQELTHRVDVRAHLGTKRRAMMAHTSQRSGGTTPRSLHVFLRLPRPLFRLVFGHEWFIERGRRPGQPLIDDVLLTLRGARP